MNLVLIRHSTSLVNPDIPIHSWGLSEEGEIAAKKLNVFSEIRKIDVIYSSLQPKALETALLAIKNLGIPLRTDDRLTESTSFTNKFVNLEQLEKNTEQYLSDSQVSINGGETAKEALNRFMDGLNDIISNEDKANNVGIVSHGNILATFCEQYSNKDVLEILNKMKQPDIAVFSWDRKKFISFFGDTEI